MPLTKYIDIFNEVAEAKSMSPIERHLIRNKKDVYTFIANHFSPLFRSLIIIFVLALIFNNYVSLDSVKDWIYTIFLVGIITLFTYKEGIKALFFLLKKLIQQLCKMFPETMKQIRNPLSRIYKLRFFADPVKWYKIALTFLIKLIIWFLLLILIVVLAPLPYIVVTAFFGLVFGLIVFFNNETLSFVSGAIALFLVNRYIQMDVNYFLPLVFILVFYVVDYYTRMHLKRFNLLSIENEYIDLIKGFELKNTSSDYEIYIDNTNEKGAIYYVIDRKLNHLKIYEENSKFIEVKKSIENWFKKRSDE